MCADHHITLISNHNVSKSELSMSDHHPSVSFSKFNSRSWLKFLILISFISLTMVQVSVAEVPLDPDPASELLDDISDQPNTPDLACTPFAARNSTCG